MLGTLLTVLTLAAFAAAIAVVWHLEGRGRWRRVLTERFVYGVPWGTLVVVAFVLAVYLFLQGGWRHWEEPLVLPFRSWSYLYPTGTLAAGFAHSSPGHLIGNLTGTVVLAPIVEYAWGHYPRGDRDGQRSLASFDDDPPAADPSAVDSSTASRLERTRIRVRRWLRTPWIRALLVFPLAVLAVGLFSSLFFLGAVIGFSGVVFALGGFALVYYPVTTMVALLLSSVVNTTYSALTEPIVPGQISGGAPSLPWWANVAIQAHWLGVLVGVVLGLALLLARERRPEAGRIFLAALVYGVVRNLYAVYWMGNEGSFTLYRSAGLVLVVAFAALVTVAAAASDRSIDAPLAGLPGRPSGRQIAGAWLLLIGLGVAGTAAVAVATLSSVAAVELTVVAALVGLVVALPALPARIPPSLLDEPLTNRQAAFAVLLVCTALFAGPSVFQNLATTADDAVPGTGEIEVEDYTVTYEEGAQNRLVPVVPLPALQDQTSLTTSGVIVVSEERHVWLAEVSRQYLASEGRATVHVGGVGWRETVVAERTGWRVAGNDSAYVVDLHADGESVRSFASGPSTADHSVANYTVTVVPTEEEFSLRVSRDDERVGERAIPEANGSTTVGDLTIEAVEENGRVSLFAASDGTRVRFAQRERYRSG